MVQSSYHLSSYHLPKEISKLKPFADSLLLHSKKQKRLHNIHRFIFLLVLLAGHIFLSFIILLLPWWAQIIGIIEVVQHTHALLLLANRLTRVWK